MKINRIESKHPRRNKIKDSILVNIFYFIYLHWMVLAWIVALAISVFVLLFVAEKLAPSMVHFLGYAMNRRMFDEMKMHNNYHAAAFIMEQNPNFLKSAKDGIGYQYKLADVYSSIGEYNKAENILLRLFYADTTANDAFKELYLPESANNPNVPKALAKLRFSSGIALTDLYEKMGDFPNQKKYYLEATTALSPADQSFIGNMVDSLYKSVLNAFMYGDEQVKDLWAKALFLREAKIRYHEDKDAATRQLQAFVDSICQGGFRLFSPEFKLKHITQLVEWKLTDGHKLSSYPYLYLGVDICENVRNPNDDAFRYAGKLSEQCYAVGDSVNGYKLLQLYLAHLSYKYDERDVERLKGNILLCRYYEQTGQWAELTKELTDVCDGLKSKISENFVGLSSRQREFLAASLREPFDLAVEVAIQHPSSEIANLCFDNLIFERGLLLRADMAQRLSVSNNMELKSTYDEWAKAKRELSYRQYMSGPGNAIAKWELTQKIADLDKQLAMNPELTETTEHFPSRGKIQSRLEGNGYFIEFGESGGLLYALILPKSERGGNAEFMPLCREKDIADKLTGEIDKIYTDEDMTNVLMGPLLAKIPPKAYIAYSVSGLFSQISLPALCVKYDYVNSLHMGDVYDFRLYSSPISFVETPKEQKLIAQNDVVSLWGGIDYGIEDTISDIVPPMRGLRPGQALKPLPGSQHEILSLSSLLSQNNHIVNVYTGLSATKDKFIDDSPNILHISTHGSFDSENKDNPLATSYLFFANANKAWMHPLSISANQEGIVNGSEVEAMELSDCKLVVLSACETGLGYSNTREGVYGLQRAFKLAGVQSILMSMWNVNDAVTARYMIAFYQALLSGDSARDAVRHAQTEIRKHNPSPKDWGAFVLMD